MEYINKRTEYIHMKSYIKGQILVIQNLNIEEKEKR